jgi:hypothetical protein
MTLGGSQTIAARYWKLLPYSCQLSLHSSVRTVPAQHIVGGTDLVTTPAKTLGVGATRRLRDGGSQLT